MHDRFEIPAARVRREHEASRGAAIELCPSAASTPFAEAADDPPETWRTGCDRLAREHIRVDRGTPASRSRAKRGTCLLRAAVSAILFTIRGVPAGLECDVRA
jgi:hypothetical protein